MFKRSWEGGADGRNSRFKTSPDAGTLSHDCYSIGWICALPLEMAAARAMLDEVHEDLPNTSNDLNGYIFGVIGVHYVVIACLPSGVYGTTPAALVVSQMQSSFPSIRFYLMVGIGGGVPSSADIRLGDVVVSTPTGKCPGVVQYDRGKTVVGGRFEQTGSLNGPPRGLLNLVSKLRAIHLTDGNSILDLLEKAIERRPPKGGLSFIRPGREDILFRAEYDHLSGLTDTCDECDESEISIRPTRETQDPVVHYGVIASGNRVMKDAKSRDSLAKEYGAYCFEMEAAGLADVVECLVIRGICDYCDSHKNKWWQGYAAATAAAYAKELLLTLSTTQKSLGGPPSGAELPAGRRAYTDEFSIEYKMRSLRSLSFPNMTFRQHSIASAHKNTCDWFFKTEKFQQWRNRTDIEAFNGVLWIKGKPGTGKSTLMKHTLRYCKTDPQLRDYAIAAYFFSARGTGLEKSRCGMLRSLLYQLCEQDPEVHNRFLLHFRSKEREYGRSWEWHEGELESFLLDTISSITPTKPVILLVDALDECDESEVRKVVVFLEELSWTATQSHNPNGAKKSLNICLSSRHYPTISMTKMLDLIVERREEHTEDIVIYIQDKLKFKDKGIEYELLRKADGIFMWIVLVVEMLNQAYDDGDIGSVRAKLEEAPADLDEVFHTLLEKDNPGKHRTVLMLQFVLFAKNRLDPAELYYAVQSGSELKNLGQRDKSVVTDQLIDAFIISGSRGLLEVHRQKYSSFVQFIHQTAKDFLLRNNRLQKLDPQLMPNFVGASHQRIVSCCLAYLESIHDLSDFVRKRRDYYSEDSPTKCYPFLGYSLDYIFNHAEDAHAGGVSQEGFLQCLQDNPRLFERLKEMHDIYMSYKYGYLRDGFKRKAYGSGASLLYVLSLKRCPKLVRTLLNSFRGCDNGVNDRGGSYVTPLRAAVAVITYDDDINLTEEVVQVLIDAGADINASGGLYFNALHAAIYPGNVSHDFEKAIAIISILIKEGADVNAQGGYFGNVLQAASLAEADDLKYCDVSIPELIKFLLDAGSDVNAQGGYYGNALQAAAASVIHRMGASSSFQDSVKKVIRVLLDAGADVNAQGGLYGNALQAACASAAYAQMDSYNRGAMNEIVQMLLDAGADVNAQGGYYGNALQAAVLCNKSGAAIEVIKTLLNKGADVNAQGGRYVNAVDAAFKSGCECVRTERGRDSRVSEVLELLLSAGAVGAAEAKKNIDEYCFWAAHLQPPGLMDHPSYELYRNSASDPYSYVS
ncbi:hypothetical protein TWF718_009726 [Orbilia javanica]|uniref:Nucleoside phosphorylase domain-containing protein n=1 Tax=Orbilia javanica TaxID=47235 RepID=A0AAN8NQY4_9PEZI